MKPTPVRPPALITASAGIGEESCRLLVVARVLHSVATLHVATRENAMSQTLAPEVSR